jgi:hypothetical protein
VRSLIVVPLVVGSIACGAQRQTPAPAAGPPAYRAVHIDTLAPDKVERFVAARRAWVAELARDHANDGRGVFVQVGDHTMYTIRAFATFADFDTRGEAIERSMANVPEAASDAYDAGADSSLVFPHTSEVWQVDPALSYAPASGAVTEATAAVGRIVLDDVRPDPTSGDRYWGAVGDEDAALAEAHYPLTRLGFRTTFGAGHVITLWLAPSQAVLDGAPSVEQAVASVRGAERAAAIEAQLAGAIEHRTTEPVTVRHDLTRLATP